MYIGKEPIVGNFQKCDALTASATASYTLQVGGTNVVPESVNHMLVSLNGILQAPTTSFTVSGSTLTFASALTSSDSIDFVILLGNVLDLGVPSDSTVGLGKLTASGTASSSTFLRGDNSWATPSGSVKQFVYNEITSTGSTTTQIPFDDTIPQNTEGAEVITQAITPTSSSSKLIITLNGSWSQQNYNGYIWALFQDSTANALKSWFFDRNGDSGSHIVTNGSLQFIMAAGTTSSTTFKFRFGPCGSYTAYWGDDQGSGRGGGTFEKQSMSIMEVE